MNKRNNFKLPKEIDLQVIQVNYTKIASIEFIGIEFRLKNYEEQFRFVTTKEPIEKRLYEILIVEETQLTEIYSNKKPKKNHIREERVDDIKAKILESIETNDEFAECKIDLLLLLA
ncbi:hypothetical protein [Bacillus cereus group sp. TH152-1LC]|uniref:hypothetical protein n=1 Tax=Bacillus cereus group sp. TH152-1LC TaxID=3018060 RepID=UPI0022E177D4|nr:hypothetical protein [Bacillus cereus group sp. TH152-1LC]MDA1675342.1 hypothetical protein [Bacillus cereus group sp. TH152-1LC]